MCVSGVNSRCKIPTAISGWSRDVRAIAGGVPGYSMAARPLGGQKRKGETPTEGFGIGSTVSCPTSRRVRELVKRCCGCTRHSTCSTAGPSACACKCCTAVQQCTGCYWWGRCKNRGRLMPSPTTERGLLGIFPRGADPPATNQRATTLPVLSPTSLSLRAILAAGARGWGERLQGPEGGGREKRRRRRE